MKVGLGYVRNNNWKPRIFSGRGAQRYADSLAKRSLIPNAIGLVSDQGTYWRVNVAGQPTKGDV